MATIDYSALRAGADTSIRAAGAAFTLSQFADDLGTDTGEVSRTPTKSIGAAVATQFDSKDIDGTLIMEKDIKFLVSALLDNGNPMPEPKTGDEAEFGGIVYECIASKSYNFNGVIAVAFEVQGRAVAHG